VPRGYVERCPRTHRILCNAVKLSFDWKSFELGNCVTDRVCEKCYAVAVEKYIRNVDKIGTLSGDENFQRCRNEGSYVHVSAS
jgi:hypothetical protein